MATQSWWPRLSGRALETLLCLAVLSLVGQLAWPSLRSYVALPRPGKLGIIKNPVLEIAPGLADECLVYLPKDYERSSRPWPLLLYLHGAGASGNDIKQPLKSGLPALLKQGRQLPMIVIGPQCREGGPWSPTDLESLLEEMIRRYRVDNQRVFVAGYSMGGSGAWELAAAIPEQLAGMASIAGAARPTDGSALKSLPIWAFHGDHDDVVNVSASQAAIDVVRQAGGTPQLTIFEGADHGIENRVFGGGELFEWMAAGASVQ
jgi:predicted peptidase